MRVMRRPSLEEKHRSICTASPSPAGSDVIGSSRSASPADTHLPVSAGINRPSVGHDADTLLTAAQSFIEVTSRTCALAIANSRPVSGPMRQFITSPAISTSSRVTCVTAAADTCVCPPGEFQIAVATALPPPQLGFATSPTEHYRDVSVSAVQHCAVLTSTSSAFHSAGQFAGQSVTRSQVALPSTILLQQVHSCEVSWPSVQRATTPTRPDAVPTSTPSLTRPSHDTLTNTTCPDSSHDVGVKLSVSASHVVSVSPLSLTTSASSSPSTDIPPPTLQGTETPPPPYPGRVPIHSSLTPRRLPPPPPISDMEVDSMLAVVEMSAGDVVPAADTDTDDDVTAAECQHMESPRPVRRADHDHRCETKVICHVCRTVGGDTKFYLLLNLCF